MSFISYEFGIFFAVVFVSFHLIRSIQLQNALIVLASYVFYASWDWRFTPLLLGISLANYVAGLLIDRSETQSVRRALLVAAVAISLIALAIFKYFNFFVDSAASIGSVLGLALHKPTLQIILPLGISFMTFQGIAYVVDVYRGDHPAEKDLIRFLAFKAFFPQLVAGPIERAHHLLAQFHKERVLTETKAVHGIWLLVYGYALKIVVADNLAPLVDTHFVKDQPFAWSVVLASVAFGIQIYADFYGYSLIAKGAALLLGFDLIWNFRFPYFATSISVFWRRWHVSLSNWLRDYLYIPLGGSRGGSLLTARNLILTMTLGGLWHGASWNFVFWGL